MNSLFLDSAFVIALVSVKDQCHKKAVDLARKIESEGSSLVTTRAIILEIGNALSKLRYRQAAIDLIEALENDPSIDILPIADEPYKNALHLFKARPDKEWGPTDCLSFVVMEKRNLDSALTTDVHFKQAGFNILLD